jgi:Fe2+ transport system protein B
MNLKDLSVGEAGRVTGFEEGARSYRKKLLAMGLTPGTAFSVDASNLERNLYLTAQLIEMRRPLLVALNMIDVAEAMGMKIDVPGLAERLGCPVVPVIATEGKGVGDLKQAVVEAVASPPVPSAEITYAQRLEQAIAELLPAVGAIAAGSAADPRWLAARLLEGDDLAGAIVGGRVEGETLARLRDGLADDVDILLADGRYGFANRVTQDTVSRKSRVSRNLSDRMDRVILNRVLGIPIFLLVMHLMFMFTISVLSKVGRTIAPAFSPMGLDEENWPAAVGIFTGVLAKEQGLATGTFGAMAVRFDGAAGAFAYLLFILLYFPCPAALAAVYRETSAGWTLFVAAWTTGIGYVTSTVFYQAAVFARNPGPPPPGSAACWRCSSW